jgi:periplasmic divalent cation tolerance protein
MLVGARLAACVQILPEITSFYHWQGKIECNSETLILAKTTSDNFTELEKIVRENHTYEVPEIIAVSAEAVSDSYLNWLINEVRNYV